MPHPVRRTCYPLLPSRWPAAVIALSVALLGGGLSGEVQAQVVSQGRGTLTLMVGRGGGPVGAVASEVANGTEEPKITQRSVGWRVAGGYNFADFVGFEAAISRIGYLKNQASYQPAANFSDQLHAATALNVVEANLVGRLPLTSGLRLDFTLGAAETSLDTTLSTQLGSSLPTGQANPIHVRRFGYDAGADAEWMLSDHLSALLGYHVYPNVGSNHTLGSANGTFSLVALGLHIEF